MIDWLKSTWNKISSHIDMSYVGYLRKWIIIAVLVGVIAGVASIIFYLTVDWATWLFLGKLAGYAPPLPWGEGETVVTPAARQWVIPIVCTLGGLLSGWLVYKFAPEAEGPGTDSAINAFHNKEGFIRKRIPLVKMIASSITIGSGGSAGREGPIALIGAGTGSAVADIFKLNSHDRRIALAIGIGAGMGSIFKAPLGGALISAGIMYRRDFEFEALLPSFIASIVGYSVFASWHGWQPIFNINTGFAFNKPGELVGYLVLGLVCGGFGILYCRFFHRTRDFFKGLKIPAYFKPAIGGLLVGLMGLFLPQILGVGYGWLQLAIDNNTAALPIYIMVAVIFGKIIATGFTVGSGGSGGEFAPGLVIGGMVGGVTWWLMHTFTAIVPADPAPFVVLGMMTLFGGIAKAPLAIIIMVSEMTGNYSLLVPSMLSVVAAYLLTTNGNIYEAQVSTRADSPAHSAEYSTPLLDKLRVADAMITGPMTVSPRANLKDIADLMKSGMTDAIPVLEVGKLTGIITSHDMAKISEDKWASTLVQDVMTRQLVLGYPRETLCEALRRMTDNHISHLPIVTKSKPDTLMGLLALKHISSTYDHHKLESCAIAKG
jgi:CIC family chloride channel protein